MASNFATKLATTAVEQRELYHFYTENDEPLRSQIRHYWEDIGFDFPGVGEAWSAVFVSWNVSEAGASAQEFLFNPQHSQYVWRCIKNETDGIGVFRALPITEHAPQVGDIIQANRGGSSHTYQYAATHRSYASHCAIVTESGEDEGGRYALTIGGNESDSVGRKIVRLTTEGLIRQRETNPYMCVIQNLK